MALRGDVPVERRLPYEEGAEPKARHKLERRAGKGRESRYYVREEEERRGVVRVRRGRLLAPDRGALLQAAHPHDAVLAVLGLHDQVDGRAADLEAVGRGEAVHLAELGDLKRGARERVRGGWGMLPGG